MNKITVNAVDEFVKNHVPKSLEFAIESDTMEIRVDFDMDEAETFVERVANAVVNDSGYHPAAFRPVFVATALQMFANANVPTKKIDVNGKKTAILDLAKISDWSRFFYGLLVEDRWFALLETYCNQKVEFLLKEREKDTVVNRFIQRLSDELDRMEIEHGMSATDVFRSMTIEEKEE